MAARRSAQLLDANVLIALAVIEHEHHDVAMRWVRRNPRVALCPIVEGALVRTLLRLGESATTATAVLRGLRSRTDTEFWTDDLSYVDVDLSSVRGHRQVTDAYLVALARARGTRLATFDRALAEEHPDDTVLVPRG